MSLATGFLHKAFEYGRQVVAGVTPHNAETGAYSSKGTITPEEFVIAGDALVEKCPTWQWCRAPDPSAAMPFLPPGKQYLAIRNVPCLRRVAEPEGKGGGAAAADETVNVEGEDWSVPVGLPEEEAGYDDFADHDGAGAGGAGAAAATAADDDDDDGTQPSRPPPPPVAGAAGAEGGGGGGDHRKSERDARRLREHREYQVSITYDKGYATPTVWLVGFDATGQPLTMDQMKEDVYGDYINTKWKTVSMETHPILRSQLVHIHPCAHAQVMASMYSNLNRRRELAASAQLPPSAAGVGAEAASAGGSSDGAAEPPPAPAATAPPVAVPAAAPAVPGIGVEAYMFIFLKVLRDTVPHIAYDNTRDLDF